jgi:NADH-quinone oxidoreductase subunit N
MFAGLSWVHGVAVVSAITMVVGNLSAIGQKNVKRMLAYSSIAHVGYMLMGLVGLNSFGLMAILFYLIAYCAMNLGAFWVVSIVADLKGGADLQDFRGLGWTSPLLGVVMAIFLFSLTGIPLFAGFIGKFLLFAAVLKTPGFLWLAILGVLNSVVSLYYYSKVLKAMWLERPVSLETNPQPLKVSMYHAVALVGLALPTMVLGLYFAPVMRFAEKSLAALLS